MNSINQFSVGEEIQRTFQGMSFSWPHFLASLIALALVTLIITLLVYKPIKKMLKARHDFIQKNIDDSIAAKDKASKVDEEIDKKILDTDMQVNNMITQAKTESEKIINESIEQAKKQSEILLTQANILVEKKYKDFEQEQKEIIVENAVELAEKILKRELKDKDNKRLIQEMLEN